MKKYAIFVTLIALAEFIYILSGNIGVGSEKYSSNVLSASVSVVTIAPQSSGVSRQYTVSRATPTPKPKATATPKPKAAINTYILNTSTKKFHKPSCGSVKQMLDKNKQIYNGLRSSVINMGYSPCGKCNP